MRHELKAFPVRFNKILRNTHMMEIRLRDREFAPGDELLIREWDREANKYTGRTILVDVIRVEQSPWPPENEAIRQTIEKEYRIAHASSMRMRRKPLEEIPDFVWMEISLKEKGHAEAL